MEIKNVSVLMNANALSVPGRCRLVGVQLAYTSSTALVSKTTGTAQVMDSCTVVLTNGAGGDVLFKFGVQGGASGGYGSSINPMSFMFGDRRILFDSGIYVNQMGSATASTAAMDRDNVQLSIFYEGA